MSKIALAVVTSGVLAAYLAAAEPPAATGPLKAVVHVNFADEERQGHGLKNVENILKAAGEGASVVLVCHGGGITLVTRGRSKHPEQLGRLVKRGVRVVACENTMRDKGIKRGDLLDGVGTVPAGAVEVIRRQQAGYGYFRP